MVKKHGILHRDIENKGGSSLTGWNSFVFFCLCSFSIQYCGCFTMWPFSQTAHWSKQICFEGLEKLKFIVCTLIAVSCAWFSRKILTNYQEEGWISSHDALRLKLIYRNFRDVIILFGCSLNKHQHGILRDGESENCKCAAELSLVVRLLCFKRRLSSLSRRIELCWSYLSPSSCQFRGQNGRKKDIARTIVKWSPSRERNVC